MLQRTKVITVRLPIETISLIREHYNNLGITDLSDSKLIKFFISSQAKMTNKKEEEEKITEEDLSNFLKEVEKE